MWWFLLFIYVVMWIIVATLSLISLFHNDSRPDGEEIIIYSVLSFLRGLIWPITIWVALTFWAATKTIPYWAETLVKLYKFVKGSK